VTSMPSQDEIGLEAPSKTRYIPEGSLLAQLERQHSPMTEMQQCREKRSTPSRPRPDVCQVLSPVDVSRYTLQAHIAGINNAKTLDEEIDEIDLSSSDDEEARTPELSASDSGCEEEAVQDDDDDEDASLRLALALQEEENQYAGLYGGSVYTADLSGGFAGGEMEAGLSEEELASIELCRQLEAEERQHAEEFLAEQVEIQNRRLHQAQAAAGTTVAAGANHPGGANSESDHEGSEDEEDVLMGYESLVNLSPVQMKLTQEVIDKIPRHRSDGEGSCCVCMCDLELDDVAIKLPSCGHVFHEECVIQWLDCRTTCPICKVVIPGDTIAV